MCQDVLVILPESNDFITCRMIYLFDQTIMTIPDKCPPQGSDPRAATCRGKLQNKVKFRADPN